jgi:hypothetical protein
LKPVRVASRDHSLLQLVAGALDQDDYAICEATTPDELGQCDANECLVVDEKLLSQDPALRSHVLNRRSLVLISDRDPAQSLKMLADHPGVHHVLMRDGVFLPRQIVTTLAQMTSGKAPDVSAYLAPGSRVTTTKLRSTEEKAALLDRMDEAARATGGVSELPGVIGTVASELILNAFFNAPVDATTKQPKYRDKPRHEPLKLAVAEQIEVSYGYDDRVFVVSVKDPFGSLTRDALISNFSRSAERGSSQIKMVTQGAGVGLYMVFCASHLLDVHVTPGKQTVMTAVIGVARRFRDIEKFGNSFNYFEVGKAG